MITYKGILMLFALGAGPTDQPIQTWVWGQVYEDPAQCEAVVAVKAVELNAVNVSAGDTNKWKSYCLPAK